jgi:hypothetical protein
MWEAQPTETRGKDSLRNERETCPLLCHVQTLVVSELSVADLEFGGL